MTIKLEESILRMLTIAKITQVPEITEWNAFGITHEEADIIAYRNKLHMRILESSFLPSLRVFEFSKSSFNEPIQKGGEDTGTIND